MKAMLLAFAFLAIPGEAKDPILHAPGTSEGNKKAAEPAPCTFDWLTNKCETFANSDKERFFFPDGTSIPNPVPKLKKDRGGSAEARFQEAKDREKKIGEIRIKLGHALNQISDEMEKSFVNDDPMHEKLHVSIKKAFSQNPTLLGQIFAEDAQIGSIKLPWPLNDPKGEEDVSPEKLKKSFHESISKETLEKIVALSKKARTTIENFQKEADASAGVYEPDAVFKEQRANRSTELFEFARKKLIEKIRAGRPDAELSAGQKSAIRRMETITFLRDDASEIKNDPECQGGPQGFYNSIHHTFTLCGGLSWMPDATVIGVIGHELSHAIDPCFSQFELHALDNKKTAELFDENEQPIKETQTSLDLINLAKRLENYRRGANPPKYMGGPLSIMYSTEAVEFMQKRGILTPTAEAIAHDEGLFQSVVDCLKSQAGGGFKAEDPAHAEQLASSIAAYRKEKFGADYDKEYTAVKKACTKHPECSFVGAHSHMCEAFADWGGSSVLGSFMEEMMKGTKLETPLQRLSIAGLFVGSACLETISFNLRSRGSIADELEGMERDRTMARDPHPNSRERIEKIFLRNPTVREALGCGPGPKECEFVPGAKK